VKSTERERKNCRYKHNVILDSAVIEQDVVAHTCELSSDFWKLSCSAE